MSIRKNFDRTGYTAFQTIHGAQLAKGFHPLSCPGFQYIQIPVAIE